MILMENVKNGTFEICPFDGIVWGACGSVSLGPVYISGDESY